MSERDTLTVLHEAKRGLSIPTQTEYNRAWKAYVAVCDEIEELREEAYVSNRRWVWTLFIGMLLSMGVGLWFGAIVGYSNPVPPAGYCTVMVCDE